MRNRIFKTLTIFLLVFCLLNGCASSGGSNDSSEGGTSFSSFNFENQDLDYAQKFEIAKSGEDLWLVTINDGDRYLIVEDSCDIPSAVPEDVTVIKRDLSNIYNASSSCMDFFVSLGTLDAVTMTGTNYNSWTIDEVKAAMDEEKLAYVGKYSAPDYEYLTDKGCDLAIENSMIFHSPQTLELINGLGIPSLVEYSSYEDHPLGRMEWIKLYGILTGTYQKACDIFGEEVSKVKALEAIEKTGKTVAFFYISTNGYAVVRKPGDYITKMIEIAGGEYVFNDAMPDEDNALSTMRMQMETFFSEGYNADILVYNSTIDGGVKDLSALLDKSDIFKEFKAVKNGEVYCTERDVFQRTMSLGGMIEDFSKIMHDPKVDDKDLSYLFRLE